MNPEPETAPPPIELSMVFNDKQKDAIGEHLVKMSELQAGLNTLLSWFVREAGLPMVEGGYVLHPNKLGMITRQDASRLGNQ